MRDSTRDGWRDSTFKDGEIAHLRMRPGGMGGEIAHLRMKRESTFKDREIAHLRIER